MSLAGLRVRELFSEGAGPPVAFVHGLGVSTLYLRPVLRRFARERAVRALDLPGFGASDDPAEPLGIPELAGVAAEWLGGTAPAPVPVLANSMGCQVAVELAAARPDLVSALVLVGPTVDAAARTLSAQFVRLAADALREPPGLTAQVVFDYAFRAGPLRTFATARLMLGHRIEERAPHVAAPALVLRGQRDPIASKEWCRHLAGCFPVGRFAEIEGAAHAAHFSHPALVLAAARPLLDSIQAS